jgi:hypothetical protein
VPQVIEQRRIVEGVLAGADPGRQLTAQRVAFAGVAEQGDQPARSASA